MPQGTCLKLREIEATVRRNTLQDVNVPQLVGDEGGTYQQVLVTEVGNDCFSSFLQDEVHRKIAHVELMADGRHIISYKQ